MTEPRMKKGRGHGVELQLAVWAGKSTPVLCVHGLTANCRSFDYVAGGLAPAHQVIAFDLRGRGLSDQPDTGYSIDHHCRDIAALLDHLGLERVHLVGHSLGASIVAIFAARYPERVEKVVLIDGAGKLNKAQIGGVLKGIAPSLTRLDQCFPSIDAYLDTMKKSPFFNPWNKTLETYFRYEMAKVKGGVATRTRAAHIVEELGNLVPVDMGPIYQEIRCPTLILRAGRGLLGPDTVLLPKNALKRMVGDIERVWLVDLEQTDHYSIVLQKNRVRDRALINFFAAG